jgi:hypothetical protein
MEDHHSILPFHWLIPNLWHHLIEAWYFCPELLKFEMGFSGRLVLVAKKEWRLL